jgi:hypothetical protein
MPSPGGLILWLSTNPGTVSNSSKRSLVQQPPGALMHWDRMITAIFLKPAYGEDFGSWEEIIQFIHSLKWGYLISTFWCLSGGDYQRHQ